MMSKSNEKQSHESKQGAHENYSWGGAKANSFKEKTSMTTQHIKQKHLKHSSTSRSIDDIEHRMVEHRSRIDDSNLFLIKTVIVWILICLPGNIFALTIFCKHEETTSSSGQPIEITTNLSSKENNNPQIATLLPVEYDDNRPITSENTTNKVSITMIKRFIVSKINNVLNISSY